MFNRKEILPIFGTTLVLAIIISLVESWTSFFITFGIILLVILINIIAKKIKAHHYEAEIEIKTWEFERMPFYSIRNGWQGYKPHQKLKKKFPGGFFIPLIIKFLSYGAINWMACLIFDVKGTIYRAARKHELYQFAEVTEQEIANVAFAGVLANLFFAIIGYLINAPLFAKLNLQFAFWNSIPLGALDGTKMFFGNKTLFFISIILSTIGLVMSLIIP